jgi:hypothetical protein
MTKSKTDEEFYEKLFDTCMETLPQGKGITRAYFFNYIDSLMSIKKEKIAVIKWFNKNHGLLV